MGLVIRSIKGVASSKSLTKLYVILFYSISALSDYIPAYLSEEVYSCPGFEEIWTGS